MSDRKIAIVGGVASMALWAASIVPAVPVMVDLNCTDRPDTSKRAKVKAARKQRRKSRKVRS